MTTLSSRSTVLPSALAPTDVLIVNIDIGSMSQTSFKKFADSVRAELSKVFPNNQIVIIPGNVTISVISPTP